MRARLAGIALVAAVVSACGGGTSTTAGSLPSVVSSTAAPASSAAVTATPTAAPVPTSAPAVASSPASPTPSAGASPSAPVAGFAGLGAARIGMTTDAFAAALGRKLVVDANSGANDPCWQLALGSPTSGLWVLTEGGRKGKVSRYDITGYDLSPAKRAALPRTATGVGIGSTRAQVLAAYPGRVKATPHTYVEGGQYLRVLDGAGHAIVFETDEKGVVTLLRAGLVGPVDYIEGCL
ncbi:MAG: hypothetical protein U0Q19_20105 [Kineosporiaceae bacterium]